MRDFASKETISPSGLAQPVATRYPLLVANRHALLIGVPRYDRDEFNDPRLDAAVRCDIDAMRSALKQSDYKITECGTGEAAPGLASLNHINQAIEEACANAPAGGVLLVYFSGHGITEAGTDYMVPSDAYLSGGNRSTGRPSLRSLVPVVPPDEVLRDCRARLVVFFVDACRNESAVGEPAGAGQSMEPGGQLPFLADHGHFVLVMGCEAGQFCQYDETGSVFTRALANALDSRNSARTLQEVVTEVTGEMDRRSRQVQVGDQRPVVRYSEVLTLAGQVLVCDGDELTDTWRKVVDLSPLIDHCKDPDRIYEMVAECARHCRAASQFLDGRTGLADPWTDPSYPARVLKNVELLLRNADLLSGGASDTEVATAEDEVVPGLRSGEAALLLTAPFLREAVLAVGIRHAAAVDPADLSRTYEPGLRGDLELTHEMHQHLVRRAEGLRRRAGNQAESPAADASDQLAMWLVHRWLADRVTLWQEAGAAAFCVRAVDLVADCRGSADEGEVPHLIQAMLLAIGANPVDEQLCGRLNRPYMSDRWRMVAAVLWLAGIMAADLRRLPPVVADLVGTGMSLPLTDVQTAAGSRAEWARIEGGLLDLRLVCDQPALHDVFEDIVRRADRAAVTIRTKLGLPAALGGGLPRGFTASPSGLRPSTRDDETPKYQVPLARFQIAEEKVRELLMGRQLYGDPALAIRELYQNALDACRWRATRQKYRLLKFGEPAEWTGRITFIQDIDAEGQPFIECTDNGVGMDLDTLEHVFGNAGERFVYRQEFRVEQTDWATLDPPLRMVSNSQFGVGVFSYFMLADEISVRTRHHRRSGVPDQEAHEVRIASSGSLFQIEPAHGLPGGGTRIRLYLSGEASEVSVLRTIRDLLWISEFRVEVSEGDDREVWEPDELRYPEGTVPPLRCGEHLWWVSADGGLAADGIRTNEEGFGLVVNLRDEHRPQFTVDRRSLEDWDKDWVSLAIRNSLPELMGWPGFTLSWLWNVAESDHSVAQQIFDYAVSAGRSVKVGTAWGQATSVSLAVVGCFRSDINLFEREGRQYQGRWASMWRTGIWRNLVSARPNSRQIRPTERVSGFPVPDPIDAALIDELETDYPDAAPSADEMLVSLADPSQTVIARLRRLRRYAITGLNLSAIRYVPPIRSEVKDDDAGFLRALAAWSLPGEPVGGGLAGPLVRASFLLKQPLGEVLRRAQCLAPEEWSAPNLDLGNLRHHTCTQAEVTLLTRNFYWFRPVWYQGELMPSHLVRASDGLGRPLREILAMCDRLAPLGVRVAMRESYPQELEAVEFYALRYADMSEQEFSLLHLVLVAGYAGMTVDAAHDALGRLERIGMIVRPKLTGRAEFMPSFNDITLIEDYLRVLDRVERRRSKLLNTPYLLLVQILTGRGGWELKSAARNLVPFTAPTTAITSAEIVEVAYRMEVTIAEAVKRINEVYPEAQLPPVDRKCSSLMVPYGTYGALIHGGADRQDIEWRDGVLGIVTGALFLREPLGDFLGRLHQFRMLGAPVPAYDESIGESLNQVHLDEYDADMLTVYDEFGMERELKVITALNFVQIAGRLGWTLAETHQRFARLMPIGLTLKYPQVEFPEEIVCWYDLLILTMHYDGQRPVISGRIASARLEKAAEEIFDCAAEEISKKAAFLRDRLRIYAPLFNLELPEESARAVG